MNFPAVSLNQSRQICAQLVEATVTDVSAIVASGCRALGLDPVARFTENFPYVATVIALPPVALFAASYPLLTYSITVLPYTTSYFIARDANREYCPIPQQALPRSQAQGFTATLLA